MAETSGDVLMVPTPIGGIEARRMGRAEAGPSRWQVAYPWGVETFFGTSAEVAAYAQERVTKAGGKFSAGAWRASGNGPAPGPIGDAVAPASRRRACC
jgi:hypothetical protein